jgi:flagellar hook-associated protein 1 FlgK
MAGLFGNLTQASKALAAHQQAIQVTGRNLANINNPEYARQRVVIADRYVTQTTHGPEGTGVEVLAVQQLRDGFLDRQVVRQASDNGFLQAQYDALSNAELALGDRVDRTTDPASIGDIANSPTGIGAALDQFFNGMDALAATPNDLPAKMVAVQGAEALAERINTADERLDILQSDLEEELDSNLDEANALLSDIANLNFLIRQADSVMSGGGADLIDSRQAKLERLARLVKIDVTPEAGSPLEVRVRISGKDAVVYAMKQGELSYNAGLKTSSVTYGYISSAGISGSKILTIAPSEAANLSAGMQVKGTGASGTYVTSIDYSNGEVTLSSPLTSNASGTYFFDGKSGIQWTDGSGMPVNIALGGGEAQGRYAAVSSGGVAGARAGLKALAEALQTAVNGVYNPSSAVGEDFFSGSASGLLSVNVAAGSLKTSGTTNAGDNAYVLGIAKLRTASKEISLAKPGNTFSASSMKVIMSDVTGLKAGMTVSGSSIAVGTKIRLVDASSIPPTITLDNVPSGVSGAGGSTLTFKTNQRLLDYTRGLVTDLATATQSASSRLEEATVLETALKTQRDSVSAVSLDEETTDLLRFQKAYQANAKVISVIDEMLQSLIAMIR